MTVEFDQPAAGNEVEPETDVHCVLNETNPSSKEPDAVLVTLESQAPDDAYEDQQPPSTNVLESEDAGSVNNLVDPQYWECVLSVPMATGPGDKWIAAYYQLDNRWKYAHDVRVVVPGPVE